MPVLQSTLHGTCLDVDGSGVLILGKSGAGKSSLALRLMDRPGYGLSRKMMRSELVADDQVIITRRGAYLMGTAPAALKGKLEVRGLGIVELNAKGSTRLRLVVNLRQHAEIERLPQDAGMEILGVRLPLVDLDAALPEAEARLRAAVNWLVKAS